MVLVPSGAVFPGGIKFDRTKKFSSSGVNVTGKILCDGDILFNCGGVGTLGRSAIFSSSSMREKAVSDSFVLVIRSRNTDALSRFIFYFLQSEQASEEIIANTRGTTGITSIRTEAIMGFGMPVPPLPEQQRIVGILDKAFASFATARANAEKNADNARALYSSELDNLFTGLIDNCETIELGELIETLTDYHANGSYEVLKQHVELKDTEDYAWMVRSTDFEKGFQNEMRYITKAAYEFLKKSRVFGGEIIMSKIGNAGKVYLMPDICSPCSLAMNLFLIRLKDGRASNKYVYRFLKSKFGEAQIQARLKGAATQTITKENVRSLLIPLPSKTEQDQIVLRLENLEIETQRLESIYQKKLDAVDALKKSLLHHAFTGQLK